MSMLDSRGIVGYLLTQTEMMATGKGKGASASVDAGKMIVSGMLMAASISSWLTSVTPADPTADSYYMNEALAREYLLCTLPNSIVHGVVYKDTMAEMWNIICTEFEWKTKIMQVDL